MGPRLSLAALACLAAACDNARNYATTDSAADASALDVVVDDVVTPDVAITDSPSPDAAGDAVAADVVDAAPDAPVDAGPLADPITAPSETWTWVPFDDMFCANGSATGVGVNLSTRSDRVVIFFDGGGACWDANTCFTLRTASNLDGFGEAQFRTVSAQLSMALPLDRGSADNPWREASYVYVPYCTGDLHGGDRMATYDGGRRAAHLGYPNVTAMLRRLVRTRPSASRVLVVGANAGGYGAALHWDEIADAFPSARVDLLDDSGPTLTPASSLWSQWRAAWNLRLPAGCADCAADLGALVAHHARRHPAPARFALLSHTQDAVVRNYYGLTGAQFEAQLTTLATTRFDPTSNGRYFFVAGTAHTMITRAAAIVGGDGTALTTWLQRFDSGDAAWRSVRP